MWDEIGFAQCFHGHGWNGIDFAKLDLLSQLDFPLDRELDPDAKCDGRKVLFFDSMETLKFCKCEDLRKGRFAWRQWIKKSSKKRGISLVVLS